MDAAANVRNKTFGQNAIAMSCFKNLKRAKELKLLSPDQCPRDSGTQNDLFSNLFSLVRSKIH